MRDLSDMLKPAAVSKRDIEAAEARARGLIADIIPLLGTLPESELPAVVAHLEAALQTAKAKAETERIERKG